MRGPGLDYAILFDVCVALLRGRRLEMVRDGRHIVARPTEDGRHALIVDGSEIIHGNCYDVAALWQDLVGWREVLLRAPRRPRR